MKKLLIICLFAASLPFSLEAGRTPFGNTVTVSGSVPAGSRSIIFVFSTDFTGSLLGVTVTGANDKSITIPIPNGETSDAIPYIITAGSMRYWGIK